MSDATDAFENAISLLLFNNVNFANIGDATGLRGSTAAGSFYASLHTADPGEAGTQLTSESAYVGYARVAIARTAGGWTVTGSTVTNAAAVSFPTCTSGTSNVTYFGVGTSSSGAGTLLFRSAIPGGIAVSVNIAPNAGIGAITNSPN